MSGPGVNPYDAVSYSGHSFSQTHPARLATLAHAHGMTPPPSAGIHVLELGCGSGGNLLPMAFQYPEGHFFGIDLSARAIEVARRGADELGLRNIVFEHRDIMAVTPSLGRFDYIIAHGVYSWVPPVVREKILAIFGALLTPQGVAYVSYNALPGCRLRDIARDVMLFATRGVDEPVERVRIARQALKTIAESSDPESFYGAALRKRLEQIDELPDDLLYHDDLDPQARAFALHEVVDDANRHGLQFLAETSFPNHFEAARGAGQKLLAQIPLGDRLIRQQTLDLLIGRAFRETLLCRADIVLRPGEAMPSLQDYHLAADVRLAQGKGEAPRPGVDRFEFQGGVSVAIDLPLAKAALRRLSALWPASIDHDVLVALAIQDVGSEIGADLAEERDRLNTALLALFRAGLLDIRLEPPRLATTISERPVASAVARWQARSTHKVTDLRHRSVALDGPLVAKFLCLLDGSRDPAQLLAELNAFLADRRASSGDTDLPAKATAEEVEMHLRDMARLALLSG
jgi:SAM-dependent methyltransferase